MTHQLCEPILDNGLRNTNFFNGRLLAAEDLQTQQMAERQHHGQLGRAIGAGIVRGLEVRAGKVDSTRVVSIDPGLAINANGQPVELPVAVDIALAVQPTTTTQGGQFADCSTVGPLLASGMGAYVLLMTPAAGFLQNAPMSGLGMDGAITGCGARYQVEGVAFRLVRFDPATLAGVPSTTLTDLANLMSRTNLANLAVAPPTDRADLSMLQNRLAHACLGTDQLTALALDPLGQSADRSAAHTYGAHDALRVAHDLTDDDVPLAIVYWTLSGIRFIDMWSVRRRPTLLSWSTSWPMLVSDRRHAEAQAMLQQFQQQVDGLIGSKLDQSTFATLRSTDFFRFLPPAGLLPLGTVSSPGIFPNIFFAQQPHRDPEFIDEVQLRSLLDDALDYTPIDLAGGELVWLYRAWQNAQAVVSGSAVHPYVIFTTGQMSHRATARFDVARWDYSNYVEADE